MERFILSFICLHVICISSLFSHKLMPDGNSVSNDSLAQWELSFSEPDVLCSDNRICYGITLRSISDSFNLGSYELYFFYDGATVQFDVESKPLLQTGYTLHEKVGLQEYKNKFQLGDLPFDDDLDIVSIKVDYNALEGMPLGIDSTKMTILDQVCFEVIEQDFFKTSDFCHAAVWINGNTQSDYTTHLTNILTSSGEPTDIVNSYYTDIEPNQNCFEIFCDSIDASKGGYVLEFLDGAVRCEKNQVCYNIALKSTVDDFEVGDMDLRVLYDSDILTYINGSEHIISLGESYTVSSVVDIAVDNPITVSSKLGDNPHILNFKIDYQSDGEAVFINRLNSSPIIDNICFNVEDSKIFSEENFCPQFEWLTGNNRNNFSSRTTQVYDSDNNLKNSDLSFFKLHHGCFYELCGAENGNGFTNSAIGTPVQLTMKNSDVDCNENTLCYAVSVRSLYANFDLGAYTLRLFYAGDDMTYIPQDIALPNENYELNNIIDLYGGDLSNNGNVTFDDQLSMISISVNYDNSINPQERPLNVTSDKEITLISELCFAVEDKKCLQAIWITEESNQKYTNQSTSINDVYGFGVNLLESEFIGIDDKNGCFDSVCNTNPQTLTFVNKISTKVEIFPNPAHHYLHIIEGPQTQIISIYSAQGNQVISDLIIDPNEASRIDISNLRDGIYVIEIKDQNTGNSTLKRFVKIK